ncbi:MAG: hypothetical protein ACFFDN_07600 [Candidatus Hodarchaeota archaeon]
MKKHLIFITLLLLILSLHKTTYAQFWNEYWQNYSYRKTNYSDVKPEKREDFSIMISVIKAGYRYYLNKSNSKTSWKVGIDAFGRFENVHDFRNKYRFHDNVYNNHYKYGCGIKLRLQREYIIRHWLRYLQLDIFSEYQRMETCLDNVKYWFDFIEQTNVRIGLNGWTNSGAVYSIGQETYLDLSYHSTNFSDPGNEPYFILTFSPRVYYKISLVDLYINEELVRDFLNEGKWNRNPFSNNLKTILGIRSIFPFQKIFNINNDHLLGHASLLVFAEYSLIKYLDDKKEWPWNTELADHDIRGGFMIWWPLGESKYTPIIQNRF